MNSREANLERPRAVSLVAWIGAAGALAVPVIGGLARDGYSHTSQYISELGERGAPNGGVISLGGFLPLGVLAGVFAALAFKELRATRFLGAGVAAVGFAIAFGYGVSGVARCQPGCPASGDAGQSWHNLSGLVEYGVAPIGFLIVAIASRRMAEWRLVRYASIAGVVAFVVLAPLVERESLAGSRGGLQRVLEATLWSWVALVGSQLNGRRP